MSGSKVNMEKLFSSQFEGFEIAPSPGMWNRIRTQLFWKEFFHFSANSLNVYYTVAAAVVLISGTILVTRLADRPEPLVPEKESEMIDREMPAEEGTATTEVSAIGSEKGTGEVKKGTGVSEADPGKDQPTETNIATIAGADKVQESNAEKEKEAETPAGKSEAADRQTLKTTENIMVSVGFEASDYKGCAPLAVKYTNQSENAGSFKWSFGDGGSSVEEHPSYVFDEPGEYSVQLRITGLDGKEYTSTRKMEVFVTPKAQFEYDEDAVLSNGQPVNFYNYSRDADYYTWDFGDNERSTLSDPVHYYERPGKYNVTLKAWTANQCYDSVTVLNAFALTENNIIFPNAFTPNTSGPVGGYYTPGDPKNEVFYPVVMGEVIEYELKIYNRVGLMIFESKDINYGWDGYYKEQLSGQGVYIYKARGHYANGKTFVKSGDITLIWK